MNTEERVRVVLDAFDAVERRDRARLDALYHPEVEFHWPSALLGAWGVDARMESWDRFQPTAKERRMDPCVLAAGDDDVVVQWHFRARGPKAELFDALVLGDYRVRDGKLAYARMFFFDGASVIDFLSRTQRAPAPTADLDIVKRLFSAVRQRDGAGVLSCYAPDVIIREEPSLPYGGEYLGHEGGRRHAAGFVKCWQGLQSEADLEVHPQFFEAVGTVVVLWRQRAMRAEERLDVPAVGVYHVRNARIVEARMSYFDLPALLGFLRRAGRLVTRCGEPSTRIGPLACNLEALTTEERAYRAELCDRLKAACQSTEPLDDGYSLRLPRETTLARDALEFAMLERRCCPFIRIGIVLEPEVESMRLELRGGEDVKRFLEVALAFNDDA
jgi:uncharacterized protein